MCVKTVFKWLNGNALECVTVCPENMGFGHPSRPESGVNLGRAVSVLGRKVSQRSLKRSFLPEKGERCVKKSSKSVTTVGLLRTVGWHICRHVPYVGQGPGAHGFSPLDASRQWNEPAAFDRALDIGDLQAVPGSERLRVPESRFFVSDSIISSLV